MPVEAGESGCYTERRRLPAINPQITSTMRPDHRSDQAGPLIGAIPADGVAQICGEERTRDPRMVVKRMKPEGSLSPGVMNFAITPATNPMIMVQMKCMAALGIGTEPKRLWRI